MDAERGARRTVRCGLHGRFYDAWSAQGCPECAGGTRPVRARGAGRRRRLTGPLLLLCAGALALAHVQGRLPLLSNTVAAAVAPAPPRSVERLEAARYGPPSAWPGSPSAPHADLLDVQALERFARSLDPLLRDGRRELLDFGEPSLDAAEGSAAEATLAQDWQELSLQWDRRVTQTCVKAPAAPALDDDLHVVMAHQLLGAACQQLRVATMSAGEAPVPMKSWRQGALDQAEASIQEARTHLAEATRF